MGRKKITSAPQTDVLPQAGSVQQTAADIPVQELKDRFQSRSIPLETDFWNLIDVADCGRKAAGLSPDVTPVPDSGLTLDSTTGQLKIQNAPDGGVMTDNSGLKIRTSLDNGLKVENSNLRIAISPSNSGLTLTDSGLSTDMDLYIRIMAAVHDCQLYGLSGRMLLLVHPGSATTNPTVVYVHHRSGNFVKYFPGELPILNDVTASQLICKTPSYGTFHDVIDVMIFPIEVQAGDEIQNIRAGAGGSEIENITLNAVPS